MLVEIYTITFFCLIVVSYPHLRHIRIPFLLLNTVCNDKICIDIFKKIGLDCLSLNLNSMEPHAPHFILDSLILAPVNLTWH